MTAMMQTAVLQRDDSRRRNGADYAVMEDALTVLSDYGPDLANGMTSHAPMAVEALCAMGRPDAVMPWLERYRAGMLPRPAVRECITADGWRAALAHGDRTADWSAFFEEELRAAPWRAVLRRWSARLASGLCASAAHGVIRVGHAARSLDELESPLRRHELADALGYWAANYQELPTATRDGGRSLRPRDAIATVPIVPPELRQFSGTIVSALVGLNDFPPFARVIDRVDVSGEPAAVVGAMSDVFARIFLSNAHDFLSAIVLVHSITSVVALGHILPVLDDATARTALRYAWQTGCALYATFGSRAPVADIEPPREGAATLADMAVAHGDDHVIKLTEACVHQHALSPSPAYLAAARLAMRLLP
jgi:hypothetical protein